ncbi:MAG: hypothetical protein ACHQIL_06950 [Steroidobacterales bacterium]
MRATLILLVALAAGCATESNLATVPPPGVDLSGHWRLNVADSDDPLRLSQALSSGYGAVSPGQGPGGGARGGRSGGSRGGQPNGPLPGTQAVSIPATLVADVLRWPGAQVEIRQEAGVATFSSDGDSRVYQPSSGATHAGGHSAKKGRRLSSPPVCGWSGASLVVHVEPEDDQPGFDARYRVSDDRRRLVQVITLQGGRMTGFAMSRVWDRE